MDKAIQLIPLVCIRCNSLIPSSLDEGAWVCAQCGQGIVLDEEKGLAPLQVSFTAGIAANTIGRPFWVADGIVIMKRESYGSSGRQREEALLFWGEPRRFFIPAFSTSLEQLLAQATNLLLSPPALMAGPAARFQPVTLSSRDVPPAAEFIVMAVEAGRQDKLKKADFTLQLSAPSLWILP